MDIAKERILNLISNSGQKDNFLEETIGLPRGIIYKWKTGKNKNFKFYITEIASYFRVSTDYLLGNTDDPAPAGQKETPRPEAEATEPYMKEIYDITKQMTDAEKALFIERGKKILEGR